MFRVDIALLILILLLCGLAQGQEIAAAIGEVAEGEQPARSELPESPGSLWSAHRSQEHAANDYFTSANDRGQSRRPSDSPAKEPYHWKGLLLQSFAFDMLQNATRIMTADQSDRHLLLNKPYWSDYWASLQ